MLVDLQPATFLPGVGRTAGFVLNHLDGQRHAGLAHLGHMWMLGQVRGGAGHACGQRLVRLDDVVLGEDVQRRQCGGTGQRIAGVGVRMKKGAQGRVVVVERLIQAVGGEHRGHRQIAAGKGLGQAEEVRRDAGLLAGEHRAGAPEADGDLVVDEVHLVAVAGLAQQLEVDRVVHAHAAGTLDQRLDDDRGDVLVMLGQGLLHVREHLPRVFFPADTFGPQVAVRARHLERVQQQWLVGAGEQCHVAHRHGGHGFAVIAIGQRDEALLALAAAVTPVVEAHLQRHLDAGGAVVGVEHTLQPGRRQGDQAL